MDKAVVIAAATAAILAMLAVLPCGVNGLGVSMSLRLLPGEDIMLVADADGDGQLSMDEVIDYVATFGIPATEEQVSRFDLDDDGYLSVNEVDEATRFNGANFVRLLDSDGDGLLSLKEVDDQLHINRDGLLRLIDTDHDGYLSEEEIDSAPDEVMVLIRKLPRAFAHMFTNYVTKTTRQLEKAFRKGMASLRSEGDDSNNGDVFPDMTIENLVNYLTDSRNNTRALEELDSETDESIKELRAKVQTEKSHKSITKVFEEVNQAMARVWTLVVALFNSAKKLVGKRRELEAFKAGAE